MLVEQSMNVAVSVADRVYVMDSGQVRFSGSAEELAAHPELLWSIYVEKASASIAAATAPRTGRRAGPALSSRSGASPSASVGTPP